MTRETRRSPRSLALAVGAAALVGGTLAAYLTMPSDGALHGLSGHEVGQTQRASNGSATSHHSVTSASATSSTAGHGEVPGAVAASTVTYTAVASSSLAVLRRSGPERALDYLEARIRSNPAISGICHAVAHDIGHAALAEFHGSVGRALAVRNDVCGGGYVHGVIENALAGSHDIAKDLLRVCAPRQDGSCWHGVGHGIMLATKFDLRRSVQLCRTAPSVELTARCGEGVFMQVMTLDEAAGHVAAKGNTVSNPAQAARICRAQQGVFSSTCWFYSPTVWLQLQPDDWAGVTQWCTASAQGDGVDACVTGIGSRLVKYHPDRITQDARECGRLTSPLESDCFRGMGSYWSVHWKGLVAADSVCGHVHNVSLRRSCRSSF